MTSGSSVHRRFAVGANIGSDVSGNVALLSYGTADIISALGVEWTNFAQEFQEFRVKKLGFWFTPSTTSATSVSGPFQGGMVGAPWSQLKPTGVNSLYQSNDLVKWSTLEEKEIDIIAPTTVNAKLFTPYGTAIVLDRDFGFSFQSISPGTLAASSRIFTLLFEMWVEFRTPA